jgi:hypothetical protein
MAGPRASKIILLHWLLKPFERLGRVRRRPKKYPLKKSVWLSSVETQAGGVEI